MSLSALPFLGSRRPPYAEVRFDLIGGVAQEKEPLHLVAWIFCPQEVSDDPVVLICVPGAGSTKAYWHLDVPGFAPREYSAALALSRRGCIVVCLDPLGVGEGSRPPDGTRLTLQTMVQANAAVTNQIRHCLKTGTLCRDLPPIAHATLIGIGHGMGALLLIEQQVTQESFAALALLGSTNGPLSLPMGIGTRLEERQASSGYLVMDRRACEDFWYLGVPEAVIAENERQASPVPVGALMQMQQPDLLRSNAAQIEVPVFLANAERDLSMDFAGEVATYPASREITLLRLAASGHAHNLAPTRRRLWHRLALWCLAQRPDRRRFSGLAVCLKWVPFRVWQREMRRQAR